MVLDTEWTQDRLEENKFINVARGRVSEWHRGGRVGVIRVAAGPPDYSEDAANTIRGYMASKASEG